MHWNSVISGAVFKADKCDMGMGGGATITPKRAQSVQFIKPYFDSTQAVITQTDSPVHNLAEMKAKRLVV